MLKPGGVLKYGPVLTGGDDDQLREIIVRISSFVVSVDDHPCR